jgi:membrane-bound lytic murein transglycosylase A
LPLKKEAQEPEEAMRRICFRTPFFEDDMEMDSLLLALEKNEQYLCRLSPDEVFHYGPDRITARQVLETMRAFRILLNKGLSASQFNARIREDFTIYKAAGRAGISTTLFTGYFEPLFDAKLSPDLEFRYPIYGKPDDLVRIDLSRFKDKFKGESIMARVDGNRVVPYYSRREIDSSGSLSGKGLEIAWLKDPVDAVFLQIQGSGRLRLPDGTNIRIGYHASNGRPYRSIGRYLIERGHMTLDQMSMQAIRQYLSEHPELVQETLTYNESYVFFRVLQNGPMGNIEVPLTPGRSIALDYRLFPKAALCFFSSRKPRLNKEGEILDWVPFSRFALNQDTGGAIKGAGRADIYWGSGHYAELAAGNMRQEGDLFFLLLKTDSMKQVTPSEACR